MKKIIFISLLCLSAFLTKAQTLRINKYLVDSMISAGVQVLYYDTTHTGQWKNISQQSGGGGGSGSGTVNSGTQYRIAYYATTGTAVSAASAITGSRALASDANGVPTHSTVTTTELGYVSGVTSAIQTQLNGKQASGSYAVTTNNLSDLSNAATARTNLGATTVGGNFFTLLNPSAITFPRINADNTVSALDAATFRTAIGAGTGSGTVTSVSGTTNRITSTGGATPVIDIAATYVGQTSITTLGTVTTGTLSTGVVVGGVTMTVGSDATGVIYYRNAGGVLTRLPIGTAAQTLHVVGGLPAWVDTAAGGGGGNVTKVGTPANNQIGVWTGDGTLEGGSNLTWDGSQMIISSTTARILKLDATSGDSYMQFNTTGNTITTGAESSAAGLRYFIFDDDAGIYRLKINSSGENIFEHTGQQSLVRFKGSAREVGFGLDASSLFSIYDYTNVVYVAAFTAAGEAIFGGGTTDNGDFKVQNTGNLYNSGNILMGGTPIATSATKTFHLFNGTAPSASVTDGVLLYSEDVAASAELKVRDEAGNITVLGPHTFTGIPGGRSEEMAWAFYSERDGKYINVDMLKLARAVEKLTGEKLVFIGKTTDELPNKENK